MTEAAESRFRIIFAKLAQATSDQPASAAGGPASEATPRELDEIDQLRRLVLEITEPEQTSYTTT